MSNASYLIVILATTCTFWVAVYLISPKGQDDPQSEFYLHSRERSKTFGRLDRFKRSIYSEDHGDITPEASFQQRDEAWKHLLKNNRERRSPGDGSTEDRSALDSPSAHAQEQPRSHRTQQQNRRRHGNRHRNKARKKKRTEDLGRPAIHVVPQTSPGSGALRVGFDTITGKINVDWEPRTSRLMDLNYRHDVIPINVSGTYFVYGQVYHMVEGHTVVKNCISLSMDTVNPWRNMTHVLCTINSPTQKPGSLSTRWVNKQTNYVGGVLMLQAGSSLAMTVSHVLAGTQHNSILAAPELTYFGAFMT